LLSPSSSLSLSLTHTHTHSYDYMSSPSNWLSLLLSISLSNTQHIMHSSSYCLQLPHARVHITLLLSHSRLSAYPPTYNILHLCRLVLLPHYLFLFKRSLLKLLGSRPPFLSLSSSLHSLYEFSIMHCPTYPSHISLSTS